MDRDAEFAARLGQQQRLFAEHEYGGTAEKMRGDHGAARSNGARAFDDGDGVAAVTVMAVAVF